jgi:hypothetical protein
MVFISVKVMLAMEKICVIELLPPIATSSSLRSVPQVGVQERVDRDIDPTFATPK